jgi:ubiquitin carboxyl-terminal hydrolase 34
MLKKNFGGSLCNQIISKECGHVSERQESFFTLSLEIKNKRSILESLDLYIEGDVLEGENKFYCGICSRKVDALKRTCISTLPDNLIIHAKRFEYDLEIMRRIKVNDYFEFPFVLNMEPYTKEGVARSENNSLEPPHLPSYYEYKLVGILVHTGTADSGHYYSFIKVSIYFLANM